MGMGEPAHNLDNVLEAIELLGTEGAIGHKNLVFSTVGDRRVFERLPLASVKPALALSLHSTTRRIARATAAARAAHRSRPNWWNSASATPARRSYPIQYQWTLLEGVNDGDEELDRIAELLARQIRGDELHSLEHGRRTWISSAPPAERAVTMARTLLQRGILAKLRDSAGQDIEGGCGQLRARQRRRSPPMSR